MSHLSPLHSILAFVYLLLSSVSTASLHPMYQPTPSNLTVPNPPYLCTASVHWIPHQIKAYDCHEALEVFQRVEGHKIQRQRFEFLAPYAHRNTGFLPLHTPRNYTFGTCTVAVSMLITYPPRWLPPRAQGFRYRFTDVATLGDLMDAAKVVVQGCGAYARGGQSAGWARQGEFNGGIAVTVMETGSFMDKLVQSQGKGPEEGGLVLGGGGNANKSRDE